MSLFKKLDRRSYDGGYFTNPLGLAPGQIPTNGQLAAIDSGGSGINTVTALRYWPVWACVRIIADTIASLPIDVYQGDAHPVDPLPSKITTPSAYASMLEWLWQVMASLLLNGNAYGLIAAEDRLGYPTQVDLLPATSVQSYIAEDGRVRFKMNGREYGPDQIWHLPGPQLPGCIDGLSPIKFASRTIALGLESEQWGTDFYRNGINPSAVLETDQLINNDQAKDIKDRVKRGTQNRDLVVLGAGLKLNPWQVNPNDAQFIDSHRLSAIAISQVFGVPPEMIGSAASNSGTLTYANREQRAQDFLNNAVNPWLARLERALSAWFPRGTYVKFNTGALLRSDLLTRYQSYQIAIRNNIMLPSEARSLEDMPPEPALDDKPLPSAPQSQGSASNAGN